MQRGRCGSGRCDRVAGSGAWTGARRGRFRGDRPGVVAPARRAGAGGGGEALQGRDDERRTARQRDRGDAGGGYPPASGRCQGSPVRPPGRRAGARARPRGFVAPRARGAAEPRLLQPGCVPRLDTFRARCRMADRPGSSGSGRSTAPVRRHAWRHLRPQPARRPRRSCIAGRLRRGVAAADRRRRAPRCPATDRAARRLDPAG